MIFKKEQRKDTVKSNVLWGTGDIYFKEIVGKDLLKAGRLFSTITLPPKSAFGFHEHNGEFEVFYVVSGNGIYNDNGKEFPVEPGDVTYCPSGTGHFIKNDGNEDLVLVALILDEK